MRKHLSWSFLALVVFSLCICHRANAATLVGKVIEVNDGDEITIFNLNRPVRIKLLAIDAPEKDQAFGAVAKQHLFDLVYDKVVSVEYTGIGHHSSLLGRVTLKDADICAQMIRDGAAWFDHFNKNLLTESQREIYALSEQAARNERRGLWQADGSIAPWEFVKAEELKRNPVASLPSVSAAPPKRIAGPIPELTSVSLLKTGTAMPKSRDSIGIESSSTSWATDGPFRKTWKKFQPAGQNFSALLPNDGEQGSKTIPLGEHQIDTHYYRTRDGHSMLEVAWLIGPDLGETDSQAIQSGLDAIIRGVGLGYEKASGQRFLCEPTSQSNISYAGYAGAEFDLTGCSSPGMARVYTKVSGDQRQLYLGFVFYREDDENVMKFLKSFTVGTAKKESQKSKTAK